MRTAVARFLAAVGHLALALVLLSQMGRWFESLDVLSHVNPVLSALALLGVGTVLADPGFGRTHRWAAAAAGLTVVAGGAVVLLTELSPVETSTSPSRGRLKVVAANVRDLRIDPHAFGAWVRSERPDVLMLSEALSVERSFGIATEYPYRIDCLGNSFMCSTVLLSRWPPLSSQGLAKSDPENRKSLSAARLSLCIHGAPVTFVGVHLSRPIPVALQARDRRDLVRSLGQKPGGDLIVLGDFNLSSWSFTLRRLERTLDLRRLTRGLLTWPAGMLIPPFMGLDHILVSDGIEPVAVRTGPSLGSDHRSIVATLSLPSQASPCPTREVH